jgi:hypothetical protein
VGETLDAPGVPPYGGDRRSAGEREGAVERGG